MTCIAIDDEPLAIKVLEKYLNPLTDWSLVATFTDPLEGMQHLQKHPIDLLFLDIQMPELSGIGLLKTLHQPPLTVLTTAFPDYAVESYELDVVDYLLKPFSLERLLQSLQKVKTRLYETTNEQPFLSIKADRKIYRIPTSDVLYLQAFGDYVKIITPNGQYVPKTTLSELENRLPSPPFIRVHRAFLVNRVHLEYLEGNQVFIRGQSIPVSKAYREEIIQWLKADG